MKTKISFASALVLCIAFTGLAHPEARIYDLTYNYASKQWTGKSKRGYFIVPYKTQQTVRITDVPTKYTVTVVEKAITVIHDSVMNQFNTDKDTTFEFIFRSDVIESDEMEYTVVIKEGEKVVDLSKAFVKVFRGLKIDVSTGVVFHTLGDSKYHYEQDGDDFALIKDSRRSKLFPISPVVLTHAYFRGRGLVNWGGTLGLGINDNGKVGYYLGFAGLIGDRQRIVLSAGAAFRPVSVLKSQYDEGQTFTDADKPEIANVTEDQFRTGLFFSVSYNLTAKVTRK